MSKINIKNHNNQLNVQIDDKKFALNDEKIAFTCEKNEQITHLELEIATHNYNYQNELGKLDGNLHANWLNFASNDEISLFNLKNYCDQRIWTDLVEQNDELIIKIY